MKIRIDFPWGGSFELQREKMDKTRFEILCGLAAAGSVLGFFLRFVEILTT